MESDDEDGGWGAVIQRLAGQRAVPGVWAPLWAFRAAGLELLGPAEDGQLPGFAL